MIIWLPVTDATLPASSATHHGVGVPGDALFKTGADQGRVGNQQRNGLALHVRTHERAVGVVVFEERNQARRHGNELLRRHVHVMHLVGLHLEKVTAIPRRNLLLGEPPLSIHMARSPGQ